MRIRRALDDEIDEILAMDRECFPLDTPPYTSDGVLWWVAEALRSGVDRELCGYVGAYASTVCPEALYLHRVGVLPWARGQRLSERLVRAAMRHAANTPGCSGIITDTCTPAMANALYRIGWRVFSPDVEWSFERSIYMRWAA